MSTTSPNSDSPDSTASSTNLSGDTSRSRAASTEPPIIATVVSVEYDPWQVTPRRVTRSTYSHVPPSYVPRDAQGEPPQDSLIAAFFRRPYDTFRLLAMATFSSSARAELFAKVEREELYKVPRKFDISTLFAVTTAFALLFGLFGQLGHGPAVLLAIFVYITGVGLAQAVLFGGLAPRAASILAGAVLLSAGLVFTLPSGLIVVDFILFWFHFFWTLPIGYFTGALIGGVFLIADKIRKALDARAARMQLSDERNGVSKPVDDDDSEALH